MYSTKRVDAVKEEAKEESDVKVEETVYIIDSKVEVKEEKKPELAILRPLKLGIDDQSSSQAEPRPSTSQAVAEVRVGVPPPAPIKFEDPFDLAPRARYSPPPPPADRVKQRSVPGGHESAKPRLKFEPYQARR